MLVGPKNNLIQAMQSVAQDLNVDAFVHSISSNVMVARSVLGFVERMQAAQTMGMAGIAPYGEPPPVDMGLAAVETLGSVVVGVGDAVDNGIRAAFPDLEMDGKMERFNSNGVDNEPGTETNTYVLNGVHQNEESRAGQARAAATTLGKDVNLIHNSTAGFPLDELEYMKETFLGVPGPASQKLSDELYNKLTSNPPQDVEVLAYSQGSTQATLALSMTVARMKQDGMTDEEIRDIMRDHADVTFVGTPVDPNNHLQLIWNVPPGLPSVGQRRLDWYFQEQDIVLHGPTPPTSETVTTEPGGEPNFTTIRHEKDPVASWVRSVAGPVDQVVLGAPVLVFGPLAIFNPIAPGYVGLRIADVMWKIGVNQYEEEAFFGYHDYAVYDDYMRNGVS